MGTASFMGDKGGDENKDEYREGGGGGKGFDVEETSCNDGMERQGLRREDQAGTVSFMGIKGGKENEDKLVQQKEDGKGLVAKKATFCNGGVKGQG